MKIQSNISKSLLLFLAILQCCSYSFAQVVERIDPETYTEIKFISEKIGFLRSTLGLARTEDGGESWNIVMGPVPSNIKFINESVGYTTHLKKIYKTIDSGKTWSSIFNNTDYFLYDVHFPTKENGFALGIPGVLLKTTNGGNTWIKQNLPKKYYLNSIVFLDSINGFAVGDSKTIIKTSDGGKTWASIDLGEVYGAFKVKFIDKELGFIFGRGRSFITLNGGDNWKPLITLSPTSDVDFINQNTGFIIGPSKSLLKTADRGTTWSNIEAPNSDYSSIDFINEKVGFAVSPELIIKTIDGGESWIEIKRTAHLGSYPRLTAMGDQRILVPGRDGTIKTENNGETWTKVNLPNTVFGRANGGFFINRDTGFVCSALGDISTTYDGGFTWKKSSNTYYSLHHIHFPSKDTGYIVGQYGKVLTTVTRGKTWYSITDGQSSDYNESYFLTSKVGFVAGAEGLLKTNDYGKHWQNTNNVNTSLRGLSFINDTIGFAAGDYGRIIKTNDSGVTWRFLESGTKQTINSIYFSDSLHGIVGGEALLLETFDGGMTWKNIPIDTNYIIRSVFILPNGEALAAGELYQNNPETATAYSSSIILKIYCNPKAVKDIAGEKQACVGISEYQTELKKNVIYTWDVSEGGEIIEVFQNKVKIRWTSRGSFIVSVTPKTDCGEGIPTSINVTVGNGSLPLSVSEIVGNTIGCTGLYEYLLKEERGVSYRWEVSGGEIKDFKNNKIVVHWNQPGLKNITVTPFNSCGEAESFQFKVNITTSRRNEPIVSFEKEVCLGLQRMKVNVEEGIEYVWKTSDGIITRNDSILEVNWTSPGYKFVTLTAISYCNYFKETSFVIVVDSLPPVTNKIIFGNNKVCLNSPEIYKVNSSFFPYSFEWIVEGGEVLYSDSDSLIVQWITAGEKSIKYLLKNRCGSTEQAALNITAYPINRAMISGKDRSCLNATEIYYPNNLFTPYSYEWDLGDGEVLYSGQDSLIVRWNSPGEKEIRYLTKNLCDSIEAAIFNVVVSVESSAKIFGRKKVCFGQEKYYVEKSEADSLITWEVQAKPSTTMASGDTILVDVEDFNTIKVNVTKILHCGKVIEDSLVLIPEENPVISVLNNNSRTYLVSNYSDVLGWYFNNQKLEGISNDTIEIDQYGEYFVEIKSQGCIKESYPVLVTGRDSEIDNSITAYPIPFVDIVFLNTTERALEGSDISIYNYSGQNLFNLTDIMGHTVELNLSHLNSGIYFLVITRGKSIKKIKLQKL